jgi:hypothetical protein
MAKHIIVIVNGEIIGYELHSPFAYLTSLVTASKASKSETGGSEQILTGAQVTDFTKSSSEDIDQFLPMLRFEQGERLAKLSINLNAPE